MDNRTETILEVKNLSVKTKTNKELLKDVSFNIKTNRITAIIGQSGCGKSITCKSILGLLDNKAFEIDGLINYRNKNLLTLKNKEMRKIRGEEIGIIMQNPMTSFNPLIKIGEQMLDTLKAHNKKLNKREVISKSTQVIRELKIENPEAVMNSYPLSLSGGMLQRIMFGLTLLLEPKLIIADEVTTAIDASTKKMVLNEILKLKETGIGILYITHNFEEINYLADDVLVMKEGLIIERGKVEEVMRFPKQEYTKSLVNSKLLK